jgi:hypothetical protein
MRILIGTSILLTCLSGLNLAEEDVLAPPGEPLAMEAGHENCQSPCPDPCCGHPRRAARWRAGLHHSRQESYLYERPFGSLLHAYMQTQVLNGHENQLVLYHYDFHDSPVEAAWLNPRGFRQLKRLVHLVQQTGLPIVIQQATNDPHLDDLRRQAVIRQLIDLDASLDASMVVVAHVPAAGLVGREESEIIHENLLQQTFNQGAPIYGNGGATGTGGSRSLATPFGTGR